MCSSFFPNVTECAGRRQLHLPWPDDRM